LSCVAGKKTRIFKQQQPRLRDLAAGCARVVKEPCPRKKQRAQGMPGARCARSRVWCVESTRVSHHGRAEITRHSPRNGFTAYIALSRVTGLSCHPRRRSCLHRLDSSVGASGPHDFAVRLRRASSLRAVNVHHIPPHVRDDRETPLCWDGTGRACRDDLPDGESGKFFRSGLDS
jgi:hypothetical protein